MPDFLFVPFPLIHAHGKCRYKLFKTLIIINLFLRFLDESPVYKRGEKWSVISIKDIDGHRDITRSQDRRHEAQCSDVNYIDIPDSGKRLSSRNKVVA